MAAAAAGPEAKPHVGGSLSALPQHPVRVSPQARFTVGDQLPLDVPFGHFETPVRQVGVPAPLPVGVRSHLPVEFGARPVAVHAPFPAAVRSFEGPAHFPAAVREALPFGVHQYGQFVHQGPLFRQPHGGYHAIHHY